MRNKLSRGKFTAATLLKMPDSDRRDRGALAALGLMLIAIVLIAPLSLLEKTPNFAIDQATQNDQTQGLGGQPTESGQATRWPSLDAYAQWIMASFAAVATVLSAVGIFLLRRTYEETKGTAIAARTANAIAREIGQAQVRAYLTVTGGTVQYVGRQLIHRVKIRVRNTGQSPALDVRIVCQASWQVVGGREPKQPDNHSTLLFIAHNIGAGADETSDVYIFGMMRPRGEEALPSHVNFRISGFIDYKTVFDERIDGSTDESVFDMQFTAAAESVLNENGVGNGVEHELTSLPYVHPMWLQGYRRYHGLKPKKNANRA